MSVRWVLQANLGAAQDIDALARACRAQGHEVSLARVVPFSDELPQEPTEGPTLFYGSTRWTALIARSGRWRPGVYFDAQRLRHGRCVQEYGEAMLNADGQLLSVQQVAELALRPQELEQTRFVRPDEDLKEFAGEVMTLEQLQRWARRLTQVETLIDPSSLMVVAPVKALDREWRAFVVDGQIATMSRYRSRGRPDVLSEQPEEVARFVRAQLERWQPERAFVMDVAWSQGALRIIECNGLHSSGLYAANISALVRAMSALALRDA